MIASLVAFTVAQYGYGEDRGHDGYAEGDGGHGGQERYGGQALHGGYGGHDNVSSSKINFFKLYLFDNIQICS